MVFKKVFSFTFSKMDMVPILLMQTLARQDSVLNTYLQQAILSESIMRQRRDSSEAGVLARATSETKNRKKGERETTTSYTISYYNPELGTTEVLDEKTRIKTDDIATRMIEESVGIRSALPVYKFIVQPLMRKEVVPWKLEQILSEREYGTPRPPPTGAAVIPVRIIKAKAAEKKHGKSIQALISEAVLRKEKSESKLTEEILLLEEAVKAIRGGESIDKVIKRLPPLSRARYILALKKKMLGKDALLKLLLYDISFLKMLKKKLELFTLDDLIGMYKMLRGLQKR